MNSHQVNLGSDSVTPENLGKAAHTPGPWHYHAKLSGSENHRGYRIYGPGANGWTIADAIPVDEDGMEGGANARLISAAPELLDALQVAVSYLCPRVLGTGGDGEKRVLPILYAAIAKATGA